MRVCLFDIDGTLLLADGAGPAALEEALRVEIGIRGPMAEVASFAGRTDRAIAEDILSAHQIPLDDSTRARYVAAYLRLLPAQLAARRGRLLPGVVALLDRLAEQGIAVGLITGNLRDAARIKLAHFGIADRFPFGGYGDDHCDRAEVARAAIAEAERHLGRSIDPADVWVIGDTPHDVHCARAVGARAVAVETGFATRAELLETRPDALLGDLADPAVLLALLG